LRRHADQSAGCGTIAVLDRFLHRVLSVAIGATRLCRRSDTNHSQLPVLTPFGITSVGSDRHSAVVGAARLARHRRLRGRLQLSVRILYLVVDSRQISRIFRQGSGSVTQVTQRAFGFNYTSTIAVSDIPNIGTVRADGLPPTFILPHNNIPVGYVPWLAYGGASSTP